MMHLSTTLTVVWACAGTATNAGASAQPAIRTDSTEYTWTVDVDRDALRVNIRWTFTNPLPDTVFVKGCRGQLIPTLEKLVGEEWQPAIGSGSGIRAAPGAGRNATRARADGSVPVGIGIGGCGYRPLSVGIILPGASRTATSTFPVFLGRSTSESASPFDDSDGTYRLNWSNVASEPHLFRSREGLLSVSRPLPPDVEIVSPTFTLIDPRGG